MDSRIFLVVVVAASIDALMHCLVKRSKDPFTLSLLVGMMGGVLGLMILPFSGLPERQSYPWLMASVAFGCLYWIFLGWAYQSNLLALVFPVARGTAILLITAGAILILREPLSVPGILAASGVVTGLIVVSVSAAQTAFRLIALVPALAVAAAIAGFRLADAGGIRVAGTVAGYCALIYIGNAIGVTLYAAWCHRARLQTLDRAALGQAIGLAAMSIGVYMTLLFALSQEHVAVVAVLAGSSIVFVSVFAKYLVLERPRPGHIAGVAMVACGVAFLKLAQ